MICPECYVSVHRSHVRSVRERLITIFTPYHFFRCSECDWRGLLSFRGRVSFQQIKQSLFGWIMGIVLALSIAWLVVGELDQHKFKPSDASAEIKWGW